MTLLDVFFCSFLLCIIGMMLYGEWTRHREQRDRRARIVIGSKWVCTSEDKLPMTVTLVASDRVYFTYGTGQPLDGCESISVFEHFTEVHQPTVSAEPMSVIIGGYWPAEPEPDPTAMTDAELLALWFAGNQSVNRRAAGRLMALCGFTSPRLADARRMKAECWSLRQVKEAGQMERMLHVWHTHGRNANRFCHEALGPKW